MNLPEDLNRLCVGIKDSDDLLEDFQAASVDACAIRILKNTRIDWGFEQERMASLPVGNLRCTLINLVNKTHTLASAKNLSNIALLFTLGAVRQVVLTFLSWKLKLNLSLVSMPSASSPKLHSLYPQDQAMENPSHVP